MKSGLLLLALMYLPFTALAQDTFSIVAVDTLTGEIGSAGASCVTSSGTYPHGAAILSDVIPGIGAIHTQAAWNSTNQQNAHAHMMAGESPQQIIDWLITHDAQGNPATRQYGIVDFRNNVARAAAYTGINCSAYKNDTAHIFYAIQGNILLGQQIIDSMQVRFLNTPGTLGDRLMASLQGAKVVGADTRCAPRNSSSLSAFLRVAKPSNKPDSLWIDLWMAYPQSYPGIVPVDPIDSLQTLYDQWKLTTSIFEPGSITKNWVKILQGDDGQTMLDFSGCAALQGLQLKVYNLYGQLVYHHDITSVHICPMPQSAANHSLFIYLVTGPGEIIVAKGKFL
jgi:uncharacterized Ntn-hydrolase superfamily protein